MINYGELEKKWQEEWGKARLFEGYVSDKEPFMVTAAFPYVNGPQHIGHMRTYGTADVLARYKRMRGFNVLYPMGFHGTGTPILALAKRLQAKDEELIRDLKLFGIPDSELAKMTDPLYIANYFAGEIESGMHAAGYSIDWRRKLFSIEPAFGKFIEWQFSILNAKGLLTQGRHPVGWCPIENNAVGMHDTRHDVEPEIDEETVVAFKVDGGEAKMLCATYRPETIFGVTNLFVNEGAAYALCAIEGMEGRYYLAKGAAGALAYQLKITQLQEVAGTDLLAMACINPMTGERVPVLPGFFVKEDVGTGIVMSVPAHAPFDYAAIERLKLSGNQAAAAIRPVRVLEVEVGRSKGPGQGEAVPSELPALSYLRLMKIDASAGDEAIEEATKLAYKEENRFGRMLVKGYEGMGEPEARERIRKELAASGSGFTIYVLTNSPVYCRAGHTVAVRVVENQWFLNYGDEKWKAAATVAFAKVNVLPEKSRRVLESALGWIGLRAVARAQGLGTRFPIDPAYIIESLSDSTIYMTLYTIMHIIRDVPPERLSPSFFDCVFLGKGGADGVAKETGIAYDTVRKAREEFTYWYRTTSRHSSPDLIFNHLTMYLYNHVAVLPEGCWPKQIVVNGTVLSEGEKMSKSLGNIVPLAEGIRKYGADPLRFVVIAAVDLFNDSNYSPEAVNGVSERLEYLYNTASSIDSLDSGELRHIDYWLYSRLNRKIGAVTESMDALELRVASTEILYNSILELRRYFARGGSNAVVVREYVSAVTLMLCPISPHISEELWHMLGGSTFASAERWPHSDSSMVSEKVEAEEELVEGVIADARQVMSIVGKKTGKQVKGVRLIVAEDWKRRASNLIASRKNLSVAIEAVRAGKEKELGESAAKVDEKTAIDFLTSLARRMSGLKESGITQADEIALLDEARRYMTSMIGAEVSIEAESASRSARANKSLPGRPSIDAEA